MRIYKTDDPEIVAIIRAGRPVVMPTDTIYGLVAIATNKSAVENIYTIKRRQQDKPCIILISDLMDLDVFGVAPNKIEQASKYWPASVSLILPVDLPDGLEHLSRGGNSLAFRLPDMDWLTEQISQTGPLIAPSANPEGLPPARNIAEAKAYFGDEVDYVDGGEAVGQASQLISLVDDEPVRLR